MSTRVSSINTEVLANQEANGRVSTVNTEVLAQSAGAHEYVSTITGEYLAKYQGTKSHVSTISAELLVKVVQNPGGIVPSIRPLNALLNPLTLRVGNISSLRWRGIRQSKVFVTLLEAVSADILGIKRRLRLINPFSPEPGLDIQSGTVPGIFNTQNADPRYDPYTEGIRQLEPVFSSLTAIQIQYLRQQIAFKLSTLK